MEFEMAEDEYLIWEDVEREIDLRSGVCKSVNISKKYHSEYCDGRMSLPLMVAMLVLGFVTVFINLGVIIRTIKIIRQGHDKPAFYFIGNLAMSDFAVGMFVVIAFLLHITNKSDLWLQKTCMLHIGVAVTACQETIFTIVLISVDKYLYICHGLHYSTIMTRRKVFSAIIVSWCLALLVGSLPAMGLHVTWPEACYRCAFAQVISTPFAIIFFVTSVAVPLAIVVALYSVLLALALRMQKARYGGSYTGKESARNSNFRLSFMSTKTSRFSVSTKTSSSSSSSKASRRRTRRREMEEYKAELARRDAENSKRLGGRSDIAKPLEGVKLIQDGTQKDVLPLSKVPDGPEVPDAPNDVLEKGAPPTQPDADVGVGDEGMRNRDSTSCNGPKRGTEIDVGVDDDLDVRGTPPRLTSDEEIATGNQDITATTPKPGTKVEVDTDDPLSGTPPKKDPKIDVGTDDEVDVYGTSPGLTSDDQDTTETTPPKRGTKMEVDADDPLYGTPLKQGAKIDDLEGFETPPPLTSDEEITTEDEGDEKQGWRSLFPTKYMNKVMTETMDKVLFLKKCRAMKTVLLILVSFTATYVPFVVGTLVYSAEGQKRPCLLHLLNTLLYCAVVANSLINPLIYAYGYREFRLRSEKFKGIFAREKPRSYT